MAINRRQFIKRSAGAVSVSLILPKFWMSNVARGQDAADASRRVFVVIQLAGGNDGSNTVVPFTDSKYQSLRPTLGFKDTDLKDASGNSTIIGNDFGFNPAMTELKSLYDAGKVAVVLGTGYPNPNLSHFFSMDIWQTANLTGAGVGWLGRYADQNLIGKSGLSALSIGSSLPKTFYSSKDIVPNIVPGVINQEGGFSLYAFQTDGSFLPDKNNQINTFKATNSRTFDSGSFISEIAKSGFEAEEGAARLRSAVTGYMAGATYPTGNQPSTTAVSFASALKMVAEVITTIPDANLLYVTIGGFDHHSQEIGTAADNYTDKTKGQHATLLKAVSLGIKTFYDDLAAHGLADNVLMMTWSEFGRRPNENASHGTDHGTGSPQFIVGNAVKGGLYGQQPSFSDLDSAGNLKFKVDFRSIYATILDKWLGTDSQSILGAKFDNLSFLG